MGAQVYYGNQWGTVFGPYGLDPEDMRAGERAADMLREESGGVIYQVYAGDEAEARRLIGIQVSQATRSAYVEAAEAGREDRAYWDRVDAARDAAREQIIEF